MKVIVDPGCFLPERAYSSDAGYDLLSPVKRIVRVGEAVTIDTGVHVQIPNGYVGMIKSKSGLNVKHGLTSEGVIDSGYTGSIRVKLYNHGSWSYMIEIGDKIRQLVILPIITPELELVTEFEPTDRGENGFGSTGR